MRISNIVFMFVVMDANILKWKERLALLQAKQDIALDDDVSSKSIYSAIRDNPDMFEGMVFSIRTDRTTKTATYKGKRYLMRIK